VIRKDPTHARDLAVAGAFNPHVGRQFPPRNQGQRKS
jgi:hypothetical protein